MKAVMISIQPKWCELIESGKKTVEVRKTRPKLETPFKVYIYETLGEKIKLSNVCKGTINRGCGKVIGEFVCDRIHNIKLEEDFESGASSWDCGYFADEDCLSMEEFEACLKKGFGYGWHISDLVIYDKPKELVEFKKAEFLTEEDWLAYLYPNTHCHYEAWAKKFDITRPPQSWCYVEEMGCGE